MLKALISSITWKLIQDAAAAVLGRIKWGIILERLFTRLAMAFLRKLADMSSNKLLHETLDDFARQLEADGLKKAGEQKAGK